ncbi:SGNH/GDSL hydrolase family protein [Mycoplasma iguanae]|uniref:SGNH/GDSL hydrolase family protein n=1 Tax=Mycoplasma iguanae TaxID=292461 RepID=A0ABY5R7J9_9MOLU|nr:SGNH/GDSL hydrolase family protein [Mycoplasma iguanae]UVD81468.1 SGNH/GDSL hydrolase family protein [Mycoplasma iguanae]
MKTKNSMKKMFMGLGALGVSVISLSTYFALSASKNSDKNEKLQSINTSESTSFVLKNEHLITDKVNYIALGDSIAAGFNTELGSEAPGQVDKDGNISGLSYPAFLAEMIQQVQPGKLGTFENFALSGTRVVDWLYLLGEPNSDYDVTNERQYFDLLLNLDKNQNNIYKGRVVEQFKEFGIKNKDDLLNFQNKFKEANLLTISLGANDIIMQLPWHEIYLLATDKNSSKKLKAEKLQEVVAKFNSLIAELKINLDKLAKLAKKLNPNGNINFIGYPKPLLRLAKIIDANFAKVEGQTFSNFILKTLNETIKKVAQDNDANYISTYDENDWEKDSSKLSKMFLDIHPTAKGYKKMAQDILLKISLGGKYATEHNFLAANALVKNWDYNYFVKDKDSFQHQIEFNGVNNKELVQKVIGSSNALKLWEDSDLESKPEILESIKNSSVSKIMINFIEANKNNINSLIKPMMSILESWNFDKDSKIYNFLQKKDADGVSNFFKIARSFASSLYIDKVFKGIEKDLDNLNQNEISSHTLASVVRKNIFNNENVFILVKEILNSELFSTNPTEAKQFIKDIVREFINDKLIISQFLPLTSSSFNIAEHQILTQSFDTITSSLKENVALKAFISNLVEDLFIRKEHYTSQPSLEKMLSEFVSLNKSTISASVDEILNEFLKSQTNVNALQKALELLIFNKLKITNHDLYSREKISSFISKILVKLPNLSIYKNIKNQIIDKFIDQDTNRIILNNFQNETNASFNLLNFIDINKKENFQDFLEIILDKDFSNREISDLIKIVLSKIDLTSLISTFSEIGNANSGLNFITLLNDVLLNDKLTTSDHNKLQLIFNSILDFFTKGDSFDPILKLVAEQFSSNALIYLEQNISSPVIAENSKNIKTIISEFLFTAFKSDNLNQLLSSFLRDIIKNKEQYKTVKDISQFIKILVNNNIENLKTAIGNIIGEFLKNDQSNKVISEIVFGFAIDKILLPEALNASESKKNDFKNFIVKFLPNIPSLTYFKDALETLLTYLDKNIESILAGDWKKVESFAEKFQDFSINVETILKVIIETIEIKALAPEDFAKAFGFLSEFISIEKIEALIGTENAETDKTSDEVKTSNSQANIEQQFLFILNHFVSSKTFNAHDQPQRQAIVDANVVKAREIVKQILQKALPQANIKSIITQQIEKLLGSDLQKALLFTEQDTKTLIEDLYQSLIDNDSIYKIIDTGIKAILGRNQKVEKFTSVAGLIATIFQNESETLNAEIKKFIEFFITSTKVKEQISKIIFKQLSPSKKYEDVNTENKEAVNKFIDKFIGNINSFSLYNELLNKLLDSLKEESFVAALIDGDKDILLNKIKEVFDYTNYQSYGKLMKLLEIEAIDKELWTNLLNAILGEIDLVSLIKPQVVAAAEKTGKNSNKLADSLKIVQALFKEELSSEAETKLIDIAKALTDKLFDSSNSLYQNIVKNLTDASPKLLDGAFKAYPKFESLKDEYKDFVSEAASTLLNDSEISSVVKKAIENLVKERKQYSTDEISSWSKFLVKFYNANKDDLFDSLQKIVDNFLKSSGISDKLYILLEKTLKIYLDISQNLTESEISTNKQVVSTILSKFSSTSFYKELIDKVQKFLEENLETIIEGTSNKEELEQKLRDLLKFDEEILISLLEIIEWDELSAGQINAFINSFILKLPNTKLEEFFGLAAAAIATTPTSPAKSTDKTTANQNRAFEIISKILKSKYIDQATGEAEKVIKNKTKLESIFKNLVDQLLGNTNINSFVKAKAKEFLVAKMTTSLETNEQVTGEFVDALLDYSFKNTFIKDTINKFVKDIFQRNNDYAKAKDATEFIDTFFSENEIKAIENNIDSVFQGILELKPTSNLVAEILIAKLKLKIPNNKTNDYRSTIHELLTGAKKSLKEIPQWDKIKKEFFKLFRELKLKTFTTEDGINRLVKALEALDLTNMDGVIGLGKLIDNNKIPVKGFANLINYVFEYSPLPANIDQATATDHPLFFGLNNINKDPDKNKRTKLTWLSALKDALSGKLTSGGSGNGGGVDLTGSLKHIYKKLFEEYNKTKSNKKNEFDKNNVYYKAIYRIAASALWYAWETYIRESSDKLIFWNITNTTVEGQLFEYLKSSTSTTLADHIFGNRGKYNWWRWRYVFPTYDDYGKNDLLWMIYYYDGSDKSNMNRHRNSETIKHTIMRYIKQGHSDN